MDAWRHMQSMKALLSGGVSGAISMALDPDTQQALADYGWDNFMNGDLPPPFDWLNPPEDWADALRPVTRKADGPVAAVVGTAPNRVWAELPEFPAGSVVTASDTRLKQIHDGVYEGRWAPYFWSSAGGAVGAGTAAMMLKTVGQGSARGWNLIVYDPNFGSYPIAVGIDLPDGNVTTAPVHLGRWFGWEAMPDGIQTPDTANDVTTRRLTLPRGNVAVAPVYRPVSYSWAQVDYANLLKQVAGLQVRDTVAEDDYLGAEPGGKVIIPPKGPVLVVPGEPLPHPPGPGTKEKKARVGAGLLKVAQSIFHGITEYGDAVDAIFEAIPKKDRCKTKSLVGKSWCIFTHLDKVDVGDAIVNLAWNQFEDWVIAKGLFAVNANAARARGDKYGFRTLNSVNGLGGLEDLGKLYGEFSQEYVNPRKEDLKKFLTDRFGI